MKAYFITEDEDGEGHVVIADSLDEAIELAYESGIYRVVLLGDYSEGLYGFELKNENIEGLEKGVVELLEGLKRGLYSYISTEYPCPSCGQEFPHLAINELTDEIYCDNKNCPARPKSD